MPEVFCPICQSYRPSDLDEATQRWTHVDKRSKEGLPIVMHTWSVGDCDTLAARRARVDPEAHKKRHIIRVGKVVHVNVPAENPDPEKEPENAEWRNGKGVTP